MVANANSVHEDTELERFRQVEVVDKDSNGNQKKETYEVLKEQFDEMNRQFVVHIPEKRNAE